MSIPLPEKLRPKKLSEYIGQKHLVGTDGVVRKLLRSAKETGFFPSLILWGPPGVGKTTLARIIAGQLKRELYEFSAVDTGVKEIEGVLKNGGLLSPLVIIDEIHRFNKSQQAKFLPYIEQGSITLVGATTENPSFEIIGPLLSRSRVLILNALTEKELRQIVKRAFKSTKIKIDDKAEDFLVESSNGDARILLNTLEIASSLAPGKLKISDIEAALQKSQLIFDKRGEEYYNVISAFIKSMRASDADAALYYLARMIEAGQDPLYIARRMVIFASEDIGMAVPTALVVANEVFRACETIGYPECQENLAHGVVYLALARKDRSAYNAYMEALSDVRKHGNLPVPLKIRNPVTKLMKEIGYGENYQKYDTESYLPDELKNKKYYKRKI